MLMTAKHWLNSVSYSDYQQQRSEYLFNRSGSNVCKTTKSLQYYFQEEEMFIRCNMFYGTEYV